MMTSYNGFFSEHRKQYRNLDYYLLQIEHYFSSNGPFLLMTSLTNDIRIKESITLCELKILK